MKVWVLIADSCMDCNLLAVRVLDHAPTDEEKSGIARDLGGAKEMYCSSVRVIEQDVNGSSVRGELRE